MVIIDNGVTMTQIGDLAVVTRESRRVISLTILALFCSLSVSCNRGSGAEQRFELKGKVVSIDKRGRTVTIAHEAIPDYMEAMTMPFTVKEDWVYEELAPGDRIQAILVVDDDRSWLEQMVFVRETPDDRSTATPGSATAAEPNAGDLIPDFALVNQDARRINLHRYRGRTLIVTFIYTRCPIPDYCPLITERFMELQKALRERPELAGRTHLLSVTVDPEYDKPKVLREYGLRAGAGNFEQWEFATGNNDEIKKIATYFGMQYWPEQDQIIHSLRTAVIGSDGTLVKLFRGNEWKTDDVLAELFES
jgi:protein SCO1/2